MQSDEKIRQLKGIIEQQLLPLIDNDYIYLDLPYYMNIGDHLIWEGTNDFLKQIPYRCLYASSKDNYLPPQINQETIILLQGGGNWGNLYPEHRLFRMNIIQSFPNNRIIILPQTIYYESPEVLEEDKVFLNRFSNVTICARDYDSYQILKKHFKNNPVLLVPDMAFYMNIKHTTSSKGHRVLYMRRKDKEFRTFENIHIPHHAEIHDWPSLEKDILTIRIINYILGGLSILVKPFSTKVSHRIKDFKWSLHRKVLIERGIKFINQYDTIYTTRLHGMILSVLLNKFIYMIDNNYGKLSSFHKTWLSDLDTINKLESIK